MKTQKLIILDYNTATVHIYSVSPGVEVDEDYVYNLGYKGRDIEWMVGRNVDIFEHRGLLV